MNALEWIAFVLALAGTLLGFRALRRGHRRGSPREKRRLWLTEIGATAFVSLIPLSLFVRPRVSEPVAVALLLFLVALGTTCLIVAERA